MDHNKLLVIAYREAAVLVQNKANAIDLDHGLTEGEDDEVRNLMRDCVAHFMLSTALTIERNEKYRRSGSYGHEQAKKG